jgi:pimeloyl-ACP methyl ester carboxylesterase
MAANGGSAAPMVPLTPHADNTCLQPGSGNYTEPGPYKVGMMDVDLGMIESSQHTGKFTIFYPTPLETSCLHPIVAWGNGTTVMGSSTYAFFNSNAASWGMVVAASQEDNTGSGNFHKAGIDYLLKQNDDMTSMFYKKLSTRAGVAGHSQGGFGATVGSTHPNVEALVSVAGGGNPKKGVATLCLTGTMDMVEMPCTQEYQSAQGPAFLADWMNGDHTTTETIGGYIKKDPGTLQMQRLLAGWFRCFLADDQTACALFKGAPDNCGICKDMGWAKHESRNL